MEHNQPQVMENREFVGLEEEDIQCLNRNEAEKFDQNPGFKKTATEVEDELGPGGHWEEHWLTVDASGRRAYARIYYTSDRAIAVVSDGRIIRELNYPAQRVNNH